MKGEMDQVSDVFSTMGNFSAAFGMDQVSFGTLTGFYAIECGKYPWTWRSFVCRHVRDLNAV